MSRESYKSNNNVYIERYQELLEKMPDYIHEFVYHFEGSLAPRTMYAYLFDICDFFNYLLEKFPEAQVYMDITTEFLNRLTILDFNKYFHAVRARSEDPSKNVARKKASIRKLFDYLLRNKHIQNKDFLAVEAEKVRKKETIVHMEADEVNLFKNNVASGYTLTQRQKLYQERHTNDTVRNIAITSLLLGTGIRVSECVGLDLDDLLLDKNMIHVVRKGDKEQDLFFPDTVRYDLEEYMQIRMKLKEEFPDENALFLNERTGTRYTIRSVERIVKKYASAQIVGSKKITPHRLRATFATAVLETDGIEKTQKLLGHENISTTTIYAGSSDEILRETGMKERYTEEE